MFYCQRNVQSGGAKRLEWLIVGCYVDDLFVAYSHDDGDSLYRQFVTKLQDRWKVEDEGPVSDLLNVEISRDDDGSVYLRQTGYIDRMAKEFLDDDIPASASRNKTPADESLLVVNELAHCLHCCSAITS